MCVEYHRPHGLRKSALFDSFSIPIKSDASVWCYRVKPLSNMLIPLFDKEDRLDLRGFSKQMYHFVFIVFIYKNNIGFPLKTVL